MIHHPITTHPMHITYRLKDSIPAQVFVALTHKYQLKKKGLSRQLRPKGRFSTSPDYFTYQEQLRAIDIDFYLVYDELLDKRKSGPDFLKDSAAKQIIIDSWHHIAIQYNLIVYAICVMSNHVHVIVSARDDDASISSETVIVNHKKFTANKLNKLHNSKGRKVWAKDFFDRDIRSGSFNAVLWYVLNNPIKAGISPNPFTFPGTWWDPRLEEVYIKPYRHRWVA